MSNPLTDIINAIIGGNNDTQQVTGIKAPSPASNVATGASAVGTAEKLATGGISGLLSLTGISGTNLAVRGAKIIIGAVILLIGLAKITGLDQKAGGLAASAVKAAPFL